MDEGADLENSTGELWLYNRTSNLSR